MAGKITALLNTLTLSDLEAMERPVRRNFAGGCRVWVHLDEQTELVPGCSGALAELSERYRVVCCIDPGQHRQTRSGASSHASLKAAARARRRSRMNDRAFA